MTLYWIIAVGQVVMLMYIVDQMRIVRARIEEIHLKLCPELYNGDEKDA